MEKKTDLKTLSNKAKIQYIWDYYRWYIIGGICVVAALISLIHHFATYKESIMDIVMVNVNDPYQDNTGLDEFYELTGLDPENDEILIDSSLVYSLVETDSTNYYNEQALMVKLAAGETDLFFAPEQVFQTYADWGYLLDLSTVLTTEELDKYSDILVYGTDEETNTTFPCGVILENNDWLVENNYYSGTCYFGIMVNSKAPELALEFFHYIMENSGY